MIAWKKTFAVIWAGQIFSNPGSEVVGYAVIFRLSSETGAASFSVPAVRRMIQEKRGLRMLTIIA